MATIKFNRMQRDLDGNQPITTLALSESTGDDMQFSDLGDIDDSSGNELLEFDSNSSAVNYFRMANAATTNAIVLSAQGSDTNIDLVFSPKGTGNTSVGTGAAAGTLESNGDYDLVLQTGNATTGSITITDGANGTIALAPNGSGDVSISTDLDMTGKINLGLNGGAESASGLLMGVGTSGNPATTSVASSIFSEFRTQSTATSGDSRSLYLRHDINGAGGGGDCLRAFAKITAAASTARGAHLSLDLDAAGSVSGFGAAVDAQLMLGGAAYDDDITCANLEVYANASATVTGRTSFLRPVIQGDASAVADVNANAFFIDFSNVTASATGLIDTDITAITGYGSLKVRCPDGVTRYIPITTGS